MRIHLAPRLALLLALALILTGPVARAQGPALLSNTTTFHAAQDTMIRQNSEVTIWGDDESFVVGYSTFGINRGLVKFDLSGLPSGARVTRASYRAFYDLCGGGCLEMTIEIRRMLQDWAEDTAKWSVLSGASDPAIVATTTIPAGYNHLDQWFAWDVTALAQAWADGSLPNQGLVMHGAEGTETNYKYFTTREKGADFSPQLIVEWETERPPLDNQIYTPLLLKT